MSADALSLAQITFPPELPVSARREDLARAIRDHQVVIVAGATGSGKTTQLPKICLQLGRERIAHTQPRRIAARSIAERISEELGVELGGVVGYQVRFDDRTRTDTALKLMTDGVLLAELSRDRELRAYDTIIIDEAHERSLTIDFLLGYLKQLLPRRPELKVIVTSATIDPDSFARHFADASGTPAPIIEVSGRTYPVDIRYRPLTSSAIQDEDAETDVDGPDSAVHPELRVDRDYLQGINDALDELAPEEPGDVLVFLSGEAEIRDAEDAINGRRLPGTEVIPLYGRLSSADQHRVFDTRRAPGIRRRVVLATNVAETSLTVPGVRYVIDAGTARISRYSARAKVQRLPIEAISQASANQRSGRAGRTSAGIAIRLYAEADFARRPEFTDPEILRTNLAAVILQMISLGLGDLAAFPFLQPPDPRGIKDGLDLLRELGAISPPGLDTATASPTRPAAGHPSPTAGRVAPPEGRRVSRPDAPDRGGLDTPASRATRPAETDTLRGLDTPASRATRPAETDTLRGLDTPASRATRPAEGTPAITPVGRDLARLPVDPRFGRMLVEAKRHGVVREVAAIVAGLSIQDPRERPLERRPQADQAHARFRDPTSDFLSLLGLWNHLEEKQRELSGNAFRRMCRAEYLNYLRVREWQDLYRQLVRAGKPLGLRPGDSQVAPDSVHRAILSGLLSRIGLRDPAKKDYAGARGQRFVIFPGSAVAKKQPAAVMAAELVETSRLFARTVAAIDPIWAEELAGDLVSRSYGEPHWEKKQGAAIAYEKVTLFGVVLVARRRVAFARIDPDAARELFIRHALVEGDWPHPIERNALYAFDRANRELRRELEEVEERTRRRDILVDDEAVVEFYDRRLPRDVTDVRRFERWWKQARVTTPERLTMTAADLTADADAAATEDAYPSNWSQGDTRFRLDYRFEPGATDDGVTVEIPLAQLARVDPTGFDRLVPGLREELLTALLRSLPKPIRRNVVPAAEWARRLSAELSDDPTTPLTDQLADAIRRATHVAISGADFDLERVPAHLRMTFAAIDEGGTRVGTNKDLGALQTRFAEKTRTTVAAATVAATPGRDLERTGITVWDVGDLPRRVEAGQGGTIVYGYPALVDEGGTVAIRVFATPGEQETAHRRGVRRLLALGIPTPIAYVQEHLSGTEKLQLATSPYSSVRALLDDVLLAVIDGATGDAAPVTAAEFEALRIRASEGLVEATFAAVGLISRILAAAREVDRAISGASSLTLMAPLADARAQLAALIHPGFVRITGIARLNRLPVYLAAITHRVERMAENLGRDRVWMTEVEQATALYREAGGSLPLALNTPDRLVDVRWMLEEFRVSLFAQHLGAASPISLQRIRKALSG